MGLAAPVALAISSAAAVGTAATSVAGAISQRRQAQQAKANAARSAGIQAAQVRSAADLEREKAFRDLQRLRASVRVAGANAGVSTDGSFGDLLQQSQTDAALNEIITRQNEQNNLLRIASGFEATQSELNARSQNAILAGFNGLLNGAQTGLSLYSANNAVLNSRAVDAAAGAPDSSLMALSGQGAPLNPLVTNPL